MRKFWCPGINRHINEFVSKCEVCQKEKKGKIPFTVAPSRINTAKTIIEIDLIGPFETGEFILRYIDLFNKKAATRKLKDKSAVRVIKALEHIIRQEGKPLEILCDNGKEFSNRFLQEWCEKTLSY